MIKVIGKIVVIVVLLQVTCGQLLSQTVLYDTIPEIQKEHSPKRATLYSAILPGLGQVYNKKYYKVPIIYAGFGTLVYFIGFNNNNYNLYKNAYIDLTDDDETTNSYLQIPQIEDFVLDDPSDLKILEDGLFKQQEMWRRNRDYLYIITAVFYAANIIDASVDAHLFNFDVSEDLTFDWQPSMQLFNNEKVYCLNCTITF